MIKTLIMDVDGTLTDGKIYMSSDGSEIKAFNIKDGYGIANILPENNIIPVVLTGKSSDIVTRRCKELNIKKVIQGVIDKTAELSFVTDSLEEAAYIGDDRNDIECMKLIKEAGGITGCPSDAVDEIKALSDFVSARPGGQGAVREFIEWIVANQKG